LVCARAEAGDVRLGLEDVAAHVAPVAPVVVRERLRGGTFASQWNFASRCARRGVGFRALITLALLGALDGLRLFHAEPSGLRRFIPGTERRADCRLSCLAP
jgi:DNA polymerase III alpha subunit